MGPARSRTRRTMTHAPLTPGFIALHGNRIETLLDTVSAWMQRDPLAPLEPEIVLVQSNGMAEWVKMALARQAGVCPAFPRLGTNRPSASLPSPQRSHTLPRPTDHSRRVNAGKSSA